jgi:hypothetical protein
MQVIASWTGAHADVLWQAMRLSNESFAEQLGVAIRTIANWRKCPDMIPQPDKQAILDTALDRASDRVKAQFAELVGEASSHAVGSDPSPDPPVGMTAPLDTVGPEHAALVDPIRPPRVPQRSQAWAFKTPECGAGTWSAGAATIASRSSSMRLTCSQVNSGRSRPK